MRKISLILASLIFLVGCNKKDDNSSFLSLSDNEEISESIKENDSENDNSDLIIDFSSNQSNSELEKSEEETTNSYNFYSEDSEEDISWGEIV